ncbi:MAG: twin-arginine translocation signal domain-containing protein, partial [Candidatus Glassbacteria bacterium]
MDRRDFLRISAATAAASAAGARTLRADVPVHLWENYDFGPGPAVPDRLNQGPFGEDEVRSWATIAYSSPSAAHIRNYGTGLVGYTWEEGGPSLAARRGKESLEQHVDKLSALPFVDLLYIRCDWRDVQKSPGRLDLHP